MTMPDIEKYRSFYECLRLIAVLFSSIENQHKYLNQFKNRESKEDFRTRVRSFRNRLLCDNKLDNGYNNDYNFDYFIRYIEMICNELTLNDKSCIIFRRMYDHHVQSEMFYDILVQYVNNVKHNIAHMIETIYDFDNNKITKNNKTITDYTHRILVKDNKFNVNCFDIQQNPNIDGFSDKAFLVLPNIENDKKVIFDYFFN